MVYPDVLLRSGTNRCTTPTGSFLPGWRMSICCTFPRAVTSRFCRICAAGFNILVHFLLPQQRKVH